MHSRLESALFRCLLAPTGAQVFNPWADHDPATDISANAPLERRERLKAHLSIAARYILVGEAAGYQGCKVSGIAFTSERLILAGEIPRVSVHAHRLTIRLRPWSEPSATTVWGTLQDLGIAEHTILWNGFPWHPHKRGDLHSNRTPTPAERHLGLPVLRTLLEAHADARIFAVGRNAEWSLRSIGREAASLRHPSMGGAREFRSQLASALR